MTEPATYKRRLDLLWDAFGEDRVVFGSDWPDNAATGYHSRSRFIGPPILRSRGTSGGREICFEEFSGCLQVGEKKIDATIADLRMVAVEVVEDIQRERYQEMRR